MAMTSSGGQAQVILLTTDLNKVNECGEVRKNKIYNSLDRKLDNNKVYKCKDR